MISSIDWNLVWSALSAISAFFSLIAAIFIYVLAKNELAKNNSIAELDIYFKIKSDLNSPDSQQIYSALIEEHLRFARNQDGSVGFLVKNKENWEPFQMNRINSNLLGHIEDLALVYEKGLVTFDTIMAGYGSLILNAGNSPAIYNYISYLRNEKFKDKDLYSGFEQLYLKIHSHLTDDLKTRYRPVIC